MDKLPVKILEATFIAGSNTYASLPEYQIPEIAFIGRSNVGKSTFVNRLVNRKKLVRTSNSPGCTKQINIFKVRYAKQVINKTVHMADLPGYGYAKLSIEKRNDIAKGIVEYIRKRSSLHTVFLLVDIRRDPREDEFSILSEARNAGRNITVLLTKSDKLTKKEVDQRLQIFNNTFTGIDVSYLLSGLTTELDSVWSAIDKVSS